MEIDPPKPSFSLNVDVTNPGQFFACCGLLELAHRLCTSAPAEARFVSGRFDIVAPGLNDPILGHIMDKLRKTKIRPETNRGDRATYPVHVEDFRITLDWWIDSSGNKTPFKLWAGQQTSLGILDDLRDATARIEPSRWGDLFDADTPLTGRFGFDPRAAWNALDLGFSPNDQQMRVATFPAVELLAAVGLQRFRPREDNGGFAYSTWGTYLSAVAAPAAAAGTLAVGFCRRYRFQIARRGSYKGFYYSIPVGELT